jgi:nicotinamide-nucleotide amidase
MAEGALANSSANLTIAVSGIAGPTGGSAEKPVGLVWMAWAIKDGKVDAESQVFAGDRAEVRYQAVEYVLRGITSRIS